MIEIENGNHLFLTGEEIQRKEKFVMSSFSFKNAFLGVFRAKYTFNILEAIGLKDRFPLDGRFLADADPFFWIKIYMEGRIK